MRMNWNILPNQRIEKESPNLHPHATSGAKHPSPTQEACLCFSNDNKASVCDYWSLFSECAHHVHTVHSVHSICTMHTHCPHWMFSWCNFGTKLSFQFSFIALIYLLHALIHSQGKHPKHFWSDASRPSAGVHIMHSVHTVCTLCTECTKGESLMSAMIHYVPELPDCRCKKIRIDVFYHRFGNSIPGHTARAPP